MINCQCVFSWCSVSDLCWVSSDPDSSTGLTPPQPYAQTHIRPLLGPSCQCATCNDPEGHLPVPALLLSAPSFLCPFFSPSISLQSSILTHFLRSSSPGPAEPLIPHSVLMLPTTIPQTHRFVGVVGVARCNFRYLYMDFFNHKISIYLFQMIRLSVLALFNHHIYIHCSYSNNVISTFFD